MSYVYKRMIFFSFSLSGKRVEELEQRRARKTRICNFNKC